MKNSLKVQEDTAAHQDGRLITWGESEFGGDSSAVQKQLADIRAVCGSGGAFAAVSGNGSVVSWGDESCGASSSLP